MPPGCCSSDRRNPLSGFGWVAVAGLGLQQGDAAIGEGKVITQFAEVSRLDEFSFGSGLERLSEKSSLLTTESFSILSVLMLDQGLWTEVKVANEHLRLFAEQNALGVQASVYNVISKTWIAPSEPVDDIEQGKERAANYAQEYLQRVAGVELPSLQWKAARSV